MSRKSTPGRVRIKEPTPAETTDEDEVMLPVHVKTMTSLVSVVKQEVDEIIRTGDLSQAGEFAEDAMEPIVVNKRSSKTLRWISGFLEAVYGSNADAEVPAYPMTSIPSVPFEDRKVILLDYEISDFEQPVTYENVPSLSKLLSIRVRYRLPWRDEEKMESLIVKVPPAEKEERDLVEMSRSDRREVFCYSRIFPYLQQWALEQNVDVVFAVPRCYFARINRKLDNRAVTKIHENLPDAESLLVFQDLRPLGFGKRHFVEGLMIEEVKAAICEIAKLHALSYALQQRNKLHLTDIFGPLHKPMESALMYDILLEDAFPAVIKFLQNSEYETRDLVGKMKGLQARIRGVLTSLLEPHPPPYPTCLTHMDFWCDNIVFRRKESWENVSQSQTWETSEETAATDFEANQPGSNSSSATNTNSAIGGLQGVLGLTSILKSEQGTSSILDSSLECRILDWQMVSYGRPTHDLALLLMTSMPTDIRRQFTSTFLKYYYQVFKNTASIFGAEIYFDLHWIHKEYRKSKLLALLFIIASEELVMSDPSTQERLLQIIAEMASAGQI